MKNHEEIYGWKDQDVRMKMISQTGRWRNKTDDRKRNGCSPHKYTGPVIMIYRSAHVGFVTHCEEKLIWKNNSLLPEKHLGMHCSSTPSYLCVTTVSRNKNIANVQFAGANT